MTVSMLSVHDCVAISVLLSVAEPEQTTFNCFHRLLMLVVSISAFGSRCQMNRIASGRPVKGEFVALRCECQAETKNCLNPVDPRDVNKTMAKPPSSLL